MTKTKWSIDKAHSEIQFKAKHLMITTVTGSFKEYDAEIETEGNDFATAQIKFTADVNTVNTGNEQRDGHLKGEEFFDVAKFPKLEFVSSKMNKKAENEYTLEGNLTIRDVTRHITLNVALGGIAKDPWGNTKAGFEVSGKINRKDFGLKFHVLNEAGNMLVSDDIKLHAEIQLAKA
ncbi:MAG TPA: YceI family protein [Bacteroidia bacterium]|nr:YceI family protein [Bacteroidia bacterium]